MIRLVFLMFFSSAVVAATSTPVDQRLKEFSINVDARERWIAVYEPAGYEKGAPVVLLLHGGTQSMRKIFKRGGTQHWLTLAEREKFLLLVPNGTNNETGDAKGDNQNWNDYRPSGTEGQTEADDVSFIVRLLDWAGERYRYDPRRAFVTGASNGGMMTMRLLIEKPERFAAGAAFIASLPDAPPPKPVSKLPVALMLMNGTLDPLIKWQGGAIHSNRGEMMPVESMVQWWREVNGVAGSVPILETLPDLDPKDGCRITRSRWSAQKPASADLIFYKVEGGGHSLPSIAHPVNAGFMLRRLIGPECHDVEGAELAWQFFKSRSGP